MIFIGVDPSYTATGVAYFAGGRIHTFTHTTTHDGSTPEPARRRQIAQSILTVPGTYDKANVRCVVEGVYQDRRAHLQAVVLSLAKLNAVIMDRLWANGIPTSEQPPAAVKMFATGNGKASKDDMLKAAFEDMGATPQNHNEADACWLMAIGAFAEGVTLGMESTAQRRSIMKNFAWAWST